MALSMAVQNILKSVKSLISVKGMEVKQGKKKKKKLIKSIDESARENNILQCSENHPEHDQGPSEAAAAAGSSGIAACLLPQS